MGLATGRLGWLFDSPIGSSFGTTFDCLGVLRTRMSGGQTPLEKKLVVEPYMASSFVVENCF
jgi:hypothetical protein